VKSKGKIIGTAPSEPIVTEVKNIMHGKLLDDFGNVIGTF